MKACDPNCKSHDHWMKLATEAADDIDRMTKALEQCAAPYSTPPGTGRRCAEWVNAEFQRRMDIAYAALHPTDDAGQPPRNP